MMSIDTQFFLETLLVSYNFHDDPVCIQNYVNNWLDRHGAKWIAAAIVESIYQGRYKLVSVDRILDTWRLKQQVCCHFDYDYAELVCHQTVQTCLNMKANHQQKVVPLPVVQLPTCDRAASPTAAAHAHFGTGLPHRQPGAIHQNIKLVTKLTPVMQVA